MLPDWVPVAVGVKVTVKVQLEFPKILDPQLLVWLNGPLMAPLPKFTAVDVTFLMVIVKGWLVVPTAWAGKVSCVGLNDSADELPLRITACGLPGPSSVT